jgi:signal transduction histidine kinase
VVILATPGQMRQLVHNLIENAIKYTPENGSVRIAVGAEPVEGRTVARLRVSDTGIGIPPEHHARVFERFYRIDPSHNIPGTGLGLAIVKEIVEAFGGDISLESTAGEGSTFTVTMPALQGQAGYRPASLQIKETLDEEENHSGR